MLKVLLSAVLALLSIAATAQNTFPSSGNVGVGTTSPEELFHVNGASRFNGYAWFSRSNNGTLATALRLGQLLNSDAPAMEINTSDNGGSVSAFWKGARWGHYMTFQRESSTGGKNMLRLGGESGVGHLLSIYSEDGSTENVKLNSEGTSHFQYSLAIGTTNANGYKLAVNGDAIFTKVKVKTYSAWPDYVFQPTYRLPSLQEVEAFIQKNKHLPDVPSAKEVEEKGLDLSDNQAMLLKKIEELTLYIIEVNKKVEQQNKKLQQQENELREIKSKQ